MEHNNEVIYNMSLAPICFNNFSKEPVLIYPPKPLRILSTTLHTRVDRSAA